MSSGDLSVSCGRDQTRAALTSAIILVAIVSALVVYKSGAALRTLQHVAASGSLVVRADLFHAARDSTWLDLAARTGSYLAIIWPALVFGVLVAGAVRTFVSPARVTRFFAGAPLRQQLAASFAGAPLMLCSCCVAPVFSAVRERSGKLGPSLAVALALAGQLIFRFVPDGEIRREPESIASLSHVAGRVVTPPMGDLARRCLTLGPFDTRTIRCQRESLLGYTNLLFDVRTVRTASALPTLAAKRIEESMDLARDPVAAAGPVSARVLWTPFQPARVPSLKVGDFFRAPLAPYRPRLSFVHSYRVLGDATLAWNEVASGQSDLVREVFLDRAPETRFAGETAQTLLVARTSEDRAEKVVAEITSSTPGILVLTDLWYPGWTAQVDGKVSELRRADGFFRGVPLPPGNHRVVFRYKPLSVPIGAAVSGAGILTLLLAALARPPGRESLL